MSVTLHHFVFEFRSAVSWMESDRSLLYHAEGIFQAILHLRSLKYALGMIQQQSIRLRPTDCTMKSAHAIHISNSK